LPVPADRQAIGKAQLCRRTARRLQNNDLLRKQISLSRQSARSHRQGAALLDIRCLTRKNISLGEMSELKRPRRGARYVLSDQDIAPT